MQLNTQLSATKKDIENANKELTLHIDNGKQLSGPDSGEEMLLADARINRR